MLDPLAQHPEVHAALRALAARHIGPITGTRTGAGLPGHSPVSALHLYEAAIRETGLALARIASAPDRAEALETAKRALVRACACYLAALAAGVLFAPHATADALWLEHARRYLTIRAAAADLPADWLP